MAGSASNGTVIGTAARRTPAQAALPQGITAAHVDTTVQLLDNRVSNAGSVNVFPESGSFTNFDSWYAPLMNGTDAHVPGILKGAKITDWQVVSLSGFASGVYQNFVDHWYAQGWTAGSPLFNYLLRRATKRLYLA